MCFLNMAALEHLKTVVCGSRIKQVWPPLANDLISPPEPVQEAPKDNSHADVWRKLRTTNSTDPLLEPLRPAMVGFVVVESGPDPKAHIAGGTHLPPAVKHIRGHMSKHR